MQIILPAITGCLLIIIGIPLMNSELNDSKMEKPSYVVLQWITLGEIIVALFEIFFVIFRRYFTTLDGIFIICIFLYSLYVGLIDNYTHNYYIETGLLLIVFPLAGWYYFGLKCMLFGAMAGMCICLFLVILEYLVQRKVTLGFADILFLTLGNSLVGITHTELYWGTIALGATLTAIFTLLDYKSKHKEITNDTFIPILPMIGIVNCVVFFLLVLECRTRYPQMSSLCLMLCKDFLFSLNN